MEMKAAPIQSIIARMGVKCVGYGQSSAGKTSLVATAPRPIYIGAEKGGLSLRNSSVMALPEISNLAGLLDAHRWVTQSAEARNFDTICLDSASEIADKVLLGEKSNTKDGRKAHGQANDHIINRVFRDFRDMPQKHCYIIAKEMSVENAIPGMPRLYMPVMPNNTQRNELPYYFDVVFRYLLVPQGAGQPPWRGLQTFADGSTIAKDRSGMLNPYEPPDLGAMFEKAMR